jgi:hypothetical protein
VSAGSEPTRVIAASGKLRNGLYLRSVVLYADRISFEVFASRPLTGEDLRTLRLLDDLGTQYEMAPPEGGVLDGRAEIEFEPAVPPQWSHLHLTQPGWGLRMLNQPCGSAEAS